MIAAHEAVARSLLTRLLEETERARVTEVGDDVEALESVLAARDRMLEALEQSVRSLAAASQQARSAAHAASRAALLQLANDLDRANTGLMHHVRAERDLVAKALAATSRPDGVAAMYGGGAPSERPNLDLRL